MFEKLICWWRGHEDCTESVVRLEPTEGLIGEFLGAHAEMGALPPLSTVRFDEITSRCRRCGRTRSGVQWGYNVKVGQR